MSIQAFQALACPLDAEPLHLDGTAWRCASGHSFDVARQGYTHLLPVQQKRSRDPGDSKEMVAARRRFLNSGYYQPVAKAINFYLLERFPRQATVSCLDAGCGEGYYLRHLSAAANGRQSLALVGLDISKWAVLAAAKQDGRPNWIVGSNAHLPVQTATLDCVLCVFGFPVYTEFARVLKPGGLLLKADPGPAHLKELREIIYPELKTSSTAEPSAPAEFRRLLSKTLTFSVTLSGQEEIADLLAMTPHLYRASAQGRARASALTTLTVTVEVRLSGFEKL